MALASQMWRTWILVMMNTVWTDVNWIMAIMAKELLIQNSNRVAWHRQPELASNQPRPRPFYLPASGGWTQRDRQISQSVRSDLLFRRGDSIMFAFKIPLYRRSFSFVVLEIIAHLSFFSRTGPIVSRRIFFFFLRYFFWSLHWFSFVSFGDPFDNTARFLLFYFMISIVFVSSKTKENRASAPTLLLSAIVLLIYCDCFPGWSEWICIACLVIKMACCWNLRASFCLPGAFSSAVFTPTSCELFKIWWRNAFATLDTQENDKSAIFRKNNEVNFCAGRTVKVELFCGTIVAPRSRQGQLAVCFFALTSWTVWSLLGVTLCG